MKRIRYSKYVPDPAGEMSMEDLLNALSDYLLQSGFESPYSRWGEFDPERSMESLKQAILRALEDGELLPQELLDELMSNPARRKELEKLLESHAAKLAKISSAAKKAGDGKASAKKAAKKKPASKKVSAKKSAMKKAVVRKRR